MSVSDSPPSIAVRGVSKSFVLPREQVHTLKERVLHPLRRSPIDELQALRNISFDVQRGEFFGIVGRNGSGKSTMLKCMAGIYATDAGQIYVNGKLSAFIELGVGFNPDLAARDNVLINAAMLGLTPREARRRLDAIIDFAELRDFVDLKMKNYSSGMLVRLAFSVMIQVDAEILLIDEVLAVGDAAFQQKCFDEFSRIHASGTTIILVTHDMGAVKRFCDEALLLEHGRMVELGDPEVVGARYLELNFSKEARDAEAGNATEESEREDEEAPVEPDDTEATEEPRLGDGTAEIIDGWFEDAQGERTEVLKGGEPAAYAARVRFNRNAEDPMFALELHNSQRDVVWGPNTVYQDNIGAFAAGDEVVFRMRFDNVLAPDRYTATPAVARGTGTLAFYDRRAQLSTVVVASTIPHGGMVNLPFVYEVDRQPSDVATTAPHDAVAEVES